MAEFTPTTSDVRSLYVLSTPAHAVSIGDGKAEFDRWLEQVRTEAKIEALVEAAEKLFEVTLDDKQRDWLRNRAERIRKKTKTE